MAVLPYLLALLHLSGPASLPQTADVALTAKIVEAAQNGSLRLSLLNNTAVKLTVVTGMYAARAYPAANFKFAIHLPHQGSFRLYCGSCGPGLIGGTIAAYKIFLRPQQSAVIATVPLSDFSFFGASAEYRLCAPTTQRAELTVSLEGRQWSSGHADIRDTYWTGKASTTIPLTCDANNQ